jgi:hypothetical protein
MPFNLGNQECGWAQCSTPGTLPASLQDTQRRCTLPCTAHTRTTESAVSAHQTFCRDFAASLVLSTGDCIRSIALVRPGPVESGPWGVAVPICTATGLGIRPACVVWRRRTAAAHRPLHRQVGHSRHDLTFHSTPSATVSISPKSLTAGLPFQFALSSLSLIVVHVHNLRSVPNFAFACPSFPLSGSRSEITFYAFIRLQISVQPDDNTRIRACVDRDLGGSGEEHLGRSEAVVSVNVSEKPLHLGVALIGSGEQRRIKTSAAMHHGGWPRVSAFGTWGLTLNEQLQDQVRGVNFFSHFRMC